MLFSLPAEQHSAPQEKFHYIESYFNGTAGYKFYLKKHGSENSGPKSRNIHKNW